MNNNFLIGILVVVIIAIVGWLAYKQGFFTGAQTEQNNGGLEINLGGEQPQQ